MNKQNTNIDFLRVMNYIGGALIFFGIAFFISINWFSLNSFVKIFSTLGSAIAVYLIGLLLYLNKQYDAASATFFMIAGLILPIGLYVTFYVLNVSHSNFFLVNLAVASICLAVFLISQLLLRKTVLLLFTIIFATAFFIAVTDYLVFQSGTYLNDFYEYRAMIIGLTYILLGRYLDYDKRYPLTGLLYFFGGLNILAASYCMGGFFMFSQGFTLWKVITAILIILTLSLSIILKSRALLYLGAIFLVIYIIDMSSRFVNIFGALGWPLVLVCIGFLLILVGYMVFSLQKRIKE